MSASIYWLPISAEKRALSVWTPSAFVSAMQRAFGESPWRIGGEHLAVLKGMAAASESNGARENPFDALIRAIQDEDGGSRTIEVWPEY